MSLNQLKADIKNNNIRNLYLYFGPEDYLKLDYLNIIKKSVVQEGTETFNYLCFEELKQLNLLKDACETMPVFADRKLVVVKNSALFKTSGKSGSNEELLDIIRSLPEYVCLVFYEYEIDKRLKTVKAISNSGLVVGFDYLRPSQMAKWVVKVCRESSRKIDSKTAFMLVEYCDVSMTDVKGELDKLILYMGEKEKIDEEDIRNVCTRSIKSRIFDLTDAVSEGEPEKALKLVEEMVGLREPVPRIMFMVIRQFRLMLQIKILSEGGKKGREAAKALKLSPYAAEIMERQASAYSLNMIKKIVEMCLETDVMVKSGRLSDRMALELLVANIAK